MFTNEAINDYVQLHTDSISLPYSFTEQFSNIISFTKENNLNLTLKKPTFCVKMEKSIFQTINKIS